MVKSYNDNKPAIVFCHSKKDTEILAGELAKTEPKQVSERTLMKTSILAMKCAKWLHA